MSSTTGRVTSGDIGLMVLREPPEGTEAARVIESVYLAVFIYLYLC